MRSRATGSSRIKLGALALVGLAALSAFAAAEGSSASVMRRSGATETRVVSGTVIVKTRTVKGKVVLVNANGRTLYMFMKDQHRRVTCTGQCARYWPPLKQQGTHTASAHGAAKAALIGSDKDPAGGRVVTYAHWPLYTYIADHRAGTASGEGLNLNGGRWYVISPSGKPIKSLGSGGGGSAWG